METTKNITTWFENVLKNEDKYDIKEVQRARREKELEQQDADRAGITIQVLRFQRQLIKQQYANKLNAVEIQKDKSKGLTYPELEAKIIEEIIRKCEKKGSKFRFYGKTEEEQNAVKVKYEEIIRYFCDEPCNLIDIRRFLYLYGRFGNGKSTLVKACYKVLKQVKQDEFNWRYFHIPSLFKQAQVEKSIKPFDILFTCTESMILDEMGDVVEKLKIYGEPIDPIRLLLLDKYDKWLSNDGNGQKIVITGNLFPERRHFYHEKMEANTIVGFYDEKLLNKMKENYNLIRFPNVSFRETNTIELL